MTAGVNLGALVLAAALALTLGCTSPRAGDMAGADAPAGTPGDAATGEVSGPGNPPPPDGSPGVQPPRPDGGPPSTPDAITVPPLPPPLAGRQRVNLVVMGPGRVSQVGGGTFECTNACILDVAAGSRVTLHAEPVSPDLVDAVSFLGWSGECTGRSDCTLTLDRDRPVVASFRRFLAWEHEIPATAIASDQTGLYTWGTMGPTGRIGSQALTSRGGSEGVLARFDHQGKLQWFRTIGGTDQDRSLALALSSERTLFVFGDARGSDQLFDTMPLWGAAGGSGPFFSTVTGDGQLLATRPSRFVGAAASDSESITESSVVVVDDAISGRLVKLNGQGDTVWTLPGLSPQWGFHKMPAVDRGGNVAALHPLKEPITVAGNTFTPRGVSDNLLLSYTPAGQARWAIQLGMELSQGVSAMRFDDQGDLYLLIAFNGKLSIGSQTRSSVDGGQDIAVAKVHGDSGQLLWLLSWGSNLIDTPGGFSVGFRVMLTATFQGPVQVVSTRLEAGPALFQIEGGTGLESLVANIGRDISELSGGGEYAFYLTRNGRVGRLELF